MTPEMQKKRDELVWDAAKEGLRQTVLWGECVLMRLSIDERNDINMSYLNGGREALAQIGEVSPKKEKERG